MNRADAPKKQPIPFAVNGQREELLSKTPAGDNSASYDVGFPAVTMILKAAGGLPPKGQDMNQIIYELSSIARWFSAGGMNAFDAEFSTGIGGYPMGSVILGNDGTTRYMNTLESNTSDPNSGGSGWFNLSSGYLKTANNLSEITQAGSSAVSAARSNLGLGDAAKLGVAASGQMAEGKSSSLLPTVEAVMSLFNKRNFLSNDYIRIPDVSGGLIIQWGTASVSQSSSMAVALPVSFSTACLSVMVSNAGNNTPIAFGAAGAPNKTYFNLYSAKATGAAADPGTTWNWLAIGF
ncbi:gp53-like domain-containing protein [Lonsdalea quercina]|uniref:gp53-like domain-containing protein n=1 Tax=Lonsdalea quercina TaxID=71657 RepID=UPI003975167C